MSAPRYFVTGAAGFVGRHLCAHLIAGGARVRGLVRRNDPGLAAIGVEEIRGDLEQPAAWKAALADVDYVIHCAANASFTGGAHTMRVNVDGTRNLIAALHEARAPLRRFVFVSTIGAIDRRAGDRCDRPLDETAPAAPTSDYGRSKLEAERLVAGAGLPFAIVRPAMVVGGDMRPASHFAVFVRAALRGSAFSRFAWPGAFSVVHVDDLAIALELCATNPAAAGRTFFCAGSELSVNECFALARPARRIPLAWATAGARMTAALLPFRLKALLLPALTASDAALRQLGWQPRHTAPQALEEVISRERARVHPDADPGGQTVITGAASGLGAALVERLGARRANLLLVDRDAAGLARMQAAHPHARIAVADLADAAAVQALVQGEAWRRLPVRELFACAGIGIRGAVLEAAPERHAALFGVNVLAPLALAHAALPTMLREGFGRIVFVSSSAAFQPLPWMATYAASKTALLAMGEAWAAELSHTGVHLMSACPGGMQTNFQQTAGVKSLPSEKLMSPGLVAEVMLRALAREKSTVIISTRARAMALLARLLPRSTSVALWKKLMTQLR